MKTLFDQPLSHKDDHQTSYEAADKMIGSGKLNRQEELVYQALKTHLSYDGIEDFTAKELSYQGIGHLAGYYTIQRRLSGLRNKGKIERTGEKRDGCCVWKLGYRS